MTNTLIADRAAASEQAAPTASVRAAVLDEVRGAFAVSELPVPEIGPADALVRVTASGVCRSDWHVWNGDWTWMGLEMPRPAVLGHEVGGVVEAIGCDVTAIAVGNRVTLPFHYADGTCAECRAGRQNLCDDVTFGWRFQGGGGWASHVRVPRADLNCIPLPDRVSDKAAAALGCRYMTAYRGVVMRGRVRGGETVVVMGCGGVGLSAVQIAAAMGAQVVAVDVRPDHLERARRQGAAGLVDSARLSPEQVGQAVKDLTGGGAHLSIDAFGRAPTLLGGVHSLRKGGRHVQIGLTSQEERGEVAIPVDLMVNAELSWVGSLGCPHPDYAELVALVERGVLDPAALVSREIGLEDIDAVVRSMTDFDTDGFVVVTRF